ncbi:MAG: acyl-CoA dehydrogenase family protein [Paludibacteraceae bacterium]|nr:acyl-CoA dehydrogenase family protein [Paludibacteraceae bacterium]
MANFYTDNEALKFQLTNPEMDRIIELKEDGFGDKDKYDYAPQDVDDARDDYDKVMDIVGEIAADVLAVNADGVDSEGPHVENNRVRYASGIQQDHDALTQAGVYGISLPRKYNGLNFPMVPYVMAGEMISRGDAGFGNIWGLQDCAETIYEFASEELQDKYLPMINKGATCSMDLTEPDAGSDLQSVMLKATWSEKDNCWLLNGVKRFITNGDAEIKLVLARSEEGTKDARGLSYFVCDNPKDSSMKVRRIENKLGIHGSPTCELVFTNVKAQLVGDRKMGLIKYVMSLMNGARLGVGGQSVGVSEAAYREAVAYAKDRRQFNQAIIEMPAVYEMVSMIKARLDATRALLYETTRYVDYSKIYGELSRKRTLTKEERLESKQKQKLADALTPLTKMFASEYANQNAFDCIQIHGGSGFMRDYTCERLYRDARILTIYEGTSQLQVVAAIRFVTTGTYLEQIRKYQEKELDSSLGAVKAKLAEMTNIFEKTVATVEEKKAAAGEQGQTYLDFVARRLVEQAGLTIMGYLLAIDATRSIKENGPDFVKSAKVFVNFASAEVAKHAAFVESLNPDEVKTYAQN